MGDKTLRDFTQKGVRFTERMNSLLNDLQIQTNVTGADLVTDAKRTQTLLLRIATALEKVTRTKASRAKLGRIQSLLLQQAQMLESIRTGIIIYSADNHKRIKATIGRLVASYAVLLRLAK
jgi:hypothetical protein